MSILNGDANDRSPTSPWMQNGRWFLLRRFTDAKVSAARLWRTRLPSLLAVQANTAAEECDATEAYVSWIAWFKKNKKCGIALIGT